MTHLEAISGELLYDPQTPQYEAYQWLLNDDPAGLDLDVIPQTTLEQRYVSALLYFSTEGDSWYDSLGFLGQGDVCTWQSEASGQGISCNAEGGIEAITISKSSSVPCVPSFIFLGHSIPG